MNRVLSLPMTVTLGVTNRCNLDCKHCFASARRGYPDELDSAEMLALIDSLADLKIFRVEISGGEPFSRQDIFQLMERLATKKMRVSMNSNATLITPEAARRLAENPLFSGLSISFDGASANSHDALRGAGNFARALRGVSNLAQAGLRYKFFCVVNQHNRTELKAIVERARGLGARCIDFNGLVLGGRGKCFQRELALSTAEKSAVCEEVLALQEQYGSFVSGYYLDWARRIRGFRAQPPPQDAKPRALGFCGAGTRSCAIRADGWVVPCHSLWDAKAGNLRQQTLRQIWQTAPLFQEFRAAARVSLSEVENCRSCSYNSVCNGGCRAAGYHAEGHFRAKDPFCWLQTNG
jgi:SynChlorMet cassette radical SAM/SPASM protein ScmE